MIRVIIFAAVISFAACASTQQSTSVIPQGEWKLQQLDNTDVSTLIQPITLRLDTAQKRASGFAGCNQYFATYSIVDNTVTFSGIGSTKMFCEGTQQTENDFLKALGEVKSFQCDGKTLNFYFKGENLRLSFIKHD